VVAPHFSAFPTSIGLAATWDLAAAEEMADLLRGQLRSVGLRQALGPVMDVASMPDGVGCTRHMERIRTSSLR
jgi:beta-xylosidase